MNNHAALFEVLIANILQHSDTIICNFYITINLSTSLKRLHGQSMLADSLILVKCSIINTQFFFCYEKTPSYWSVQFFSAFHWSSTTTIQQTSYDCGILRQDYGTI